MIQLKVSSARPFSHPLPSNTLLPDVINLHRQLRRLGRRVRQRPQEAATRNDRSVPETQNENQNHVKG